MVQTIRPRYEWERVNRYGEIDRFVFIVHRYVTDHLTTVFEQATDWYKSLLDAIDASNDAMDELLIWEKHSDDLPN